jgi:uncharacterized membrane protein YgcG
MLMVMLMLMLMLQRLISAAVRLAGSDLALRQSRQPRLLLGVVRRSRFSSCSTEPCGRRWSCHDSSDGGGSGGSSAN